MLDKEKYFKELYEVESKDIPTHSFLSRDFGVKRDCKYFIETGTHLGHGVQYALDHGFENVFSCEFMQDRFDHCMNRFSSNDNVSLWLGTSIASMPEMLKQVDQKACFWLDAHDEGGGVPTFEELDLIKNHSIKNHTIIIDDIPLYFADKKNELEQKLLSINENYSIFYFPVYMSRKLVEDYQLLAYVE